MAFKKTRDLSDPNDDLIRTFIDKTIQETVFR
jgi:hypothetical protein